MKKIVILTVILILSVLLTACGAEPAVADSPEVSNPPEVVPAVDEAETETAQKNFEPTWPTGAYQFISRGWIPGFHSAIDIAAQSETDIYAAEQGEVTESGWSEEGYGNHIIIDHGNGIETLYAHNFENVVEVGDIVEKGQLIGYVGATGNTTGNALHFEIRIDGEKVPTEPYFGLEVAELEEIEPIPENK